MLSGKTVSAGGSTLYSTSYTYNTFQAKPQRKGTTNQVSKLSYNDSLSSLSRQYTYDGNGNIASEKNISGSVLYSYTYDDQNQLKTVKNGSGTTLYSYTYDTVGNIRSKTDGSTTHNYTYGDSKWADLLTKYDGQTITYDNAGNPTKYYNGKTWNMEWSKGRELSRITRGSKTWDFTYDMAGVRSGKTVTTRDASTGEITGTTEYKYTTLSGKLVRVEYNTTILDIVYDESGQPFSIRYKSSPTATGALYYYVLNAQGDVVGLLNSSGELVVEYKYDPWGKLLETIIGVDETDSKYAAYNNMGLRNPLRYRGYIYDRDTGLYYLQSRYYDPEIGRFINADTYTTTDADGLLSTNMFAYCENNPVNRSDPNGELHILAGALIGGLTSTVSALKAGEKGINLAISIGFGIASGALSAALPGAGAAVDVVMNAAESVVRGIANGENAKTIYKNAFVGAIAGAITGSMDNPLVSEKGAGQLGKFLKTAFGRKKGLHPRVKLSNKKFTRSYRREVLKPTALSTSVGVAVGYGSNKLQNIRI